jgi:molybdopterin-guanine dinucleotide biosynthesis protein A
VARTLGVLVAGGAGTRLALGVPKALARLGGVTLLERALGILAPVSDGIVVTGRAGLDLPLPPAVATPGGACPVRRADDQAGTTGPLAGIVAGLESAAFDRAIVLGVDLPFVESAGLLGLLERLSGHDAVVPVAGGFPQPLAAAYAAAATAILGAALRSGERSLTRALAMLDVLLLDDDALARVPGGPGSFFNLNTPADLEAAERRLATRGASA